MIVQVDNFSGADRAFTPRQPARSARIVIPDIADARADGPADHVVGGVGRQKPALSCGSSANLRPSRNCPDLLVHHGGRNIWIEVICPEPVGIPMEWLQSKLDEVITLPHEAILLRWTAAIKEKAEGFAVMRDQLMPSKKTGRPADSGSSEA
jgi:hypothetical protein